VAYDERLADRVRGLLARRRGVTERRMFGGLAFMLRGNMCCGVHGDELIVRVGADHYGEALARPGARPMDITGRPLTGFVFVDNQACRNGRRLAAWVERGVAFASSLPAK
jgi:TfoX/Sxy family transcriptional regulator of competence genes